ncbi:MAG: hypothetical protein B7Z55_10290 [Planctomycetales bacterium 12-60-4]|nr:MAG: hypothetical protein B7Z55_10290 [Planctomycetales bacterium 12-60-4]
MQPPPIPNLNVEHLRTLAICHYVVAAFSLLGLGFLVLHYSFMRLIFGNPQIWNNAKQPPPFNPADFFHFFQWFYIIAAVFMVVGGLLTLISGRFIHRRVNRTFSIVIGGLNCLHFPFGIILGIFTILLLTRESVMQLYVQSETKTLTDPA